MLVPLVIPDLGLQLVVMRMSQLFYIVTYCKAFPEDGAHFTSSRRLWMLNEGLTLTAMHIAVLWTPYGQ